MRAACGHVWYERKAIGGGACVRRVATCGTSARHAGGGGHQPRVAQIAKGPRVDSSTHGAGTIGIRSRTIGIRTIGIRTIGISIAKVKLRNMTPKI